MKQALKNAVFVIPLLVTMGGIFAWGTNLHVTDTRLSGRINSHEIIMLNMQEDLLEIKADVKKLIEYIMVRNEL